MSRLLALMEAVSASGHRVWMDGDTCSVMAEVD